jgi:hypothetical protein
VSWRWPRRLRSWTPGSEHTPMSWSKPPSASQWAAVWVSSSRVGTRTRTGPRPAKCSATRLPMRVLPKPPAPCRPVVIPTMALPLRLPRRPRNGPRAPARSQTASTTCSISSRSTTQSGTVGGPGGGGSPVVLPAPGTNPKESRSAAIPAPPPRTLATGSAASQPPRTATTHSHTTAAAHSAPRTCPVLRPPSLMVKDPRPSTRPCQHPVSMQQSSDTAERVVRTRPLHSRDSSGRATGHWSTHHEQDHIHGVPGSSSHGRRART